MVTLRLKRSEYGRVLWSSVLFDRANVGFCKDLYKENPYRCHDSNGLAVRRCRRCVGGRLSAPVCVRCRCVSSRVLVSSGAGAVGGSRSFCVPVCPVPLLCL